MLKKTSKFLGIVTAFSLLFSSYSPAYAKSSHSVDAMFQFSSSRSETKETYNSYSTEQRNDAPISTTIEDKNNKTQRMIVVTKKPISSAKQKELLGGHGTYNRPLNSVFGFSAYIPEKNVETLLRNEEIVDIYIDSVVTTLGYEQPTPSNVVSAPQVWEDKGIQGSGIGVAVLDTGVYEHKDLYNIVAFKDFVHAKTQPYDDNGHGTHVAGLVAGNGTMSNGQIKGTAPRVDIVGVKVLDSAERGYISDVISGIDWVIQNKEKYNIKVMNLSLGTEYSGGNDPLINAVEKATSEGILVVVAGGNNGYNGKVTSPAVSPKVLSVGSTNSKGTLTPTDDIAASFSVMPQQINGTVKPEIFAPGVDVVSLLSPEGRRAFNDRGNIVDGWYYKTSGTSMSTPVVSGSAALLFAQNPNLSPEQVKSKIVSNGLQVNGLNVLNTAKVFGLSPEWKESKAVDTPVVLPKPTEPTPTAPTPVEEDKAPIVNPEPSTPVQETTPSTKEPIGAIQPNDTPAVEEDNKNTSPFTEEVPTDKTNSFAVGEQEKVDATIPDVNPYVINDGYPFVKETYEKRNILEDLVKNSDQYKNEEEVKYEYENVQDIVMLFNLINRSFTRQDFLYFEQRMQN